MTDKEIEADTRDMSYRNTTVRNAHEGDAGIDNSDSILEVHTDETAAFAGAQVSDH